ncbi:MAG: hypothetical protein ABIQ11_04320, partial [Saprospiraceae bacterium]
MLQRHNALRLGNNDFYKGILDFVFTIIRNQHSVNVRNQQVNERSHYSVNERSRNAKKKSALCGADLL